MVSARTKVKKVINCFCQIDSVNIHKKVGAANLNTLFTGN